MITKIENDIFSAEIKHDGAELHSLIKKDTGKEYIWYGREEIWYGQSPILFPFIGKLLDDKYRYNGKEYSMQKHGFARKRPFELVSKTETEAVFFQTFDENTLAMYPFKFELFVKFELDNEGLKVTHTVKNIDDKKMYFSLGAHPGFNIEVGDSLIFDENETLVTERIDKDSIIAVWDEPLLDNAKEVVITKDIFVEDALILNSFKSKGLTLKSQNGEEILHFDMGDAPFLGVWAKPGAPYVCIEPWWGVNDSYEVKNDVSEKRGIQSLEAGEVFEYAWKAEIK